MKNKATAKQVFLYSLINYLGTAIGTLSALFIYPLDFDFLGKVRYVDNISQLLFPVMILGASHALIKFYPSLDEHKKKDLFTYSLLSIAIISAVVLVILFLFSNFTTFESLHLYWFAFPIAICLAYIELFKKQANDLQKVAVPTLLEKLIPKIILPILFLLLLRDLLNTEETIGLYVLGYIAILILTAVYIFRHYKPVFRFDFKPLFTTISKKDYFRYSLYAFTGSIGSMLAFRIDGIIIPQFFSMEANGVFSNGVTLASTLQIPAIGMFALYAPIISDYLKSENYTDLNRKYKEIAKLLFFIGALLYSCIFIGIEDLFRMLPSYEKLKATVPIIQILGLSVLINMATGFNSEIITYSKYYRFNLVTILILIALNLSLNLVFIYYTDMGITGIAIASLLAMLLFNISKLVFIYKKFGLLPFDAAFIKLLIIFCLSGFAIYFLPTSPVLWMNLVYKVGLSLVINVMVIYRLRLVYQLNFWLDKLLKKTA